MRQNRAAKWFALALMLTAMIGGLSCERAQETPAADFESDLAADTAPAAIEGPTQAPPASDDSSRVAAMMAPAASFDEQFAQRDVAEADIIQSRDGRLYALSRDAGLVVIDINDPSALRVLGRYRELPATPFEMYLRDDVALVLYTDWGRYDRADDGTSIWTSTSKLLALDVHEPSRITPMGSFDVPGSLSDSRIVGDVLYVVSVQDRRCLDCQELSARTSIISLSIADLQHVTLIDELSFDSGINASGLSSVTISDTRMYVASPERNQEQPTGTTIQVVDISDPSGQLVAGARVKVEGQVWSRWHLDEYQGVLRVLTQPTLRFRGAQLPLLNPAIETFSIESSQSLRELGRAEIVLPKRELLRSVRFDGVRGYAITAEQVDPLYTIDLSVPAEPRVVGELMIPGFVYHMEPRGERVVGLGYDRNNPAGGITVSVFDVSDMATPAELSRVNFGVGRAWLPEGQDRIHKAFRVLDDKGMILVPFSGPSSSQREACAAGDPASGVQLIDYAKDTLTRRGVALSDRDARRAILLEHTLLSVGDERVQAFDIKDRDQPSQLSQVVVARQLVRAEALDNGVVARFFRDSQQDGTQLDLVASDQADELNHSLAELNLRELAANEGDDCNTTFSMRDVIVHGSTIEVLYYRDLYSREHGTTTSQTGLLIIDASDPQRPSVVSNFQWDSRNWWVNDGRYSFRDYTTVRRLARTDQALALLETRFDDSSATPRWRLRLRVLDLRDAHDVRSSVIDLEPATEHSGLHVDGDVVMLSHIAASSKDERRGRYFIDRFDLADPSAPLPLPEINVPGALMVFDAVSGRALTSEQVRVQVPDAVTFETCRQRFAKLEWVNNKKDARASDPSVPAPEGRCTGYRQRLNLVHWTGTTATREDSLELPESQQIFSLSQGDGVAFLTVGHSTGLTLGLTFPFELLTLGGFEQGKLAHGTLRIEDPDVRAGGWFFPPLRAYGKRALLFGRSSALFVDASTPEEPTLLRHMTLMSLVKDARLHGNDAWLSLGLTGLQRIALRD